MTKDELIECPFCGNKPQFFIGADGSENINCTRCLFDFDGSTTLWQTRAPARPQGAELAAKIMREALEHLAGDISEFCPGDYRCICGSIREWASGILMNAGLANEQTSNGGGDAAGGGE